MPYSSIMRRSTSIICSVVMEGTGLNSKATIPRRRPLRAVDCSHDASGVAGGCDETPRADGHRGGIVIACGGDSETEPTATTSAGATAAPTMAAEATSVPPTQPASVTRAETSIVATLGRAYKFGPAGREVPTPEELPLAPGSVEARWYQAEGRYVVYYAGLDLSQTGPLCPGNSIMTTAGFEHITNGPSAPGACVGTTMLAGPDEGVRLCGDMVLYWTRIPVSAEGVLYGTVERFVGDDTFVGATSVVRTNLAETPTVDLSACKAVAD